MSTATAAPAPPSCRWVALSGHGTTRHLLGCYHPFAWREATADEMTRLPECRDCQRVLAANGEVWLGWGWGWVSPDLDEHYFLSDGVWVIY